MGLYPYPPSRGSGWDRGGKGRQGGRRGTERREVALPEITESGGLAFSSFPNPLSPCPPGTPLSCFTLRLSLGTVTHHVGHVSHTGDPGNSASPPLCSLVLPRLLSGFHVSGRVRIFRFHFYFSKFPTSSLPENHKFWKFPHVDSRLHQTWQSDGAGGLSPVYVGCGLLPSSRPPTCVPWSWPPLLSHMSLCSSPQAPLSRRDSWPVKHSIFSQLRDSPLSPPPPPAPDLPSWNSLLPTWHHPTDLPQAAPAPRKLLGFRNGLFAFPWVRNAFSPFCFSTL